MSVRMLVCEHINPIRTDCQSGNRVYFEWNLERWTRFVTNPRDRTWPNTTWTIWVVVCLGGSKWFSLARIMCAVTPLETVHGSSGDCVPVLQSPGIARALTVVSWRCYHEFCVILIWLLIIATFVLIQLTIDDVITIFESSVFISGFSDTIRRIGSDIIHK